MQNESPAINNIIAALTHIRGLGFYPTVRVSGITPYCLLENLVLIDRTRASYYAHDPTSLKIFDWISRCRIVEHYYGFELAKNVPGGPFTRGEWRALEAKAKAMSSGFVEGDYILDRIDTWILESYSLKGLCEVAPGDVVLDCGVYTGNTSLYFSQKVGAEGQVHGFEPIGEIFAQYKKNMRGLTNVTPVNAAITDKKGVLNMAMADAGSSLQENVVAGYPSAKVYGLSIDAYVEEKALPRVDFIKMDIEGAEEAALRGAAATIKRFRPKMAISAYHKPLDMLLLPGVIKELDPSYTFALRHFSDCLYETVLFCY